MDNKEKKQFTQEDLDKIIGGSSNNTSAALTSDVLAGTTTTITARTGAQQVAVSDNLG